MVSITIDVLNPDIFERILKVGKEGFSKALKEMAETLEGYMREEAPVGVSSNLRDTLTTEKMGDGWGSGYRVYSPEEYALAVNEGSRPHWAPFDAIAEWANMRGLEPGAVWHNIGVYGTSPNNFADRALSKLQGDAANMTEVLIQAMQEAE